MEDHPLQVTPANAQDRDRDQVAAPTAAVQEAMGESVALADVDAAYTGAVPKEAAVAQGIEPVAVRIPEAKRGFVLLTRSRACHGLPIGGSESL